MAENEPMTENEATEAAFKLAQIILEKLTKGQKLVIKGFASGGKAPLRSADVIEVTFEDKTDGQPEV